MIGFCDRRKEPKNRSKFYCLWVFLLVLRPASYMYKTNLYVERGYLCKWAQTITTSSTNAAIRFATSLCEFCRFSPFIDFESRNCVLDHRSNFDGSRAGYLSVKRGLLRADVHQVLRQPFLAPDVPISGRCERTSLQSSLQSFSLSERWSIRGICVYAQCSTRNAPFSNRLLSFLPFTSGSPLAHQYLSPFWCSATAMWGVSSSSAALEDDLISDIVTFCFQARRHSNGMAPHYIRLSLRTAYYLCCIRRHCNILQHNIRDWVTREGRHSAHVKREIKMPLWYTE